MINNSFEVMKCIVKLELSEKEKNEFKEYIISISFLDELFPCLVKNRVLNMFYYFLIKNNLTYILDKCSYRILNQIVTFTTLRAMEYEEKFIVLKENFEEAKIPYAVLKGFHLNNVLYENSSGFILRDFNDIDILVNKSDLRAINDILNRNGYIQGDLDRKSLTINSCSRREKIDMLINTHQQYQHISPSEYFAISPYNILLIDVNFTIWEGGNQPDYISSKELLSERSVYSTKSGINYWALNPEYDLIQMCYHIYKDTNYEIKKQNNEFLKMSYFYDILFFVRKLKNQIDWKCFINKVILSNLANQIYFVLSITYDLFRCEEIFQVLNVLSRKINIETLKRIKNSLHIIQNQ